MKISGEMHYLWRAVDHEGVLESFATRARDMAAAEINDEADETARADAR